MGIKGWSETHIKTGVLVMLTIQKILILMWLEFFSYKLYRRRYDYFVNLKIETNAPNRKPGAFAKSNNNPRKPTAIHCTGKR